MPSGPHEGLGDGLPGLGLELRRDRVLEVDDDLVGHQLRRLLELPGWASRYGQAGTPGPHPATSIRPRLVSIASNREESTLEEGRKVTVGGPYFEDLEHGQVFDAPALTLTWGHAAIHQAIAGDRLLLALDAPLSREVTGSEEALIHPNLVCDVAIGQSTVPTQRVLGNLFYRGLVLLRQVFRGDTLRTRTEVVALKQNRTRAGRQRLGAGGAADPDRKPGRRAGARLLSLPDDPARDPGWPPATPTASTRSPSSSTRNASGPRSRAGTTRRCARGSTSEPTLEPGTVHVVEGRDRSPARPSWPGSRSTSR